MRFFTNIEWKNYMTRDEMIANLASSVCEVTFKKANGEERVMRCTLVSDLLPPKVVTTPILEDLETPKTQKKPSIDVIPVFDLHANGWRSFRVDSVTNFRLE
jgi:hypothetical protein